MTSPFRHRARGARLAAFALLAWTTYSTAGASSGEPNSLRIATWNLEWLIAPADFKRLKDQCAPSGTRARSSARRLPCDVARRLERSSRDFAVLERYARELDADVVALQEVDGPAAARLVFPGYEFCFTSRSHVQNTGFAIRRGVPFRCGPDLKALSVGDTVRRGAELILLPDSPGEIRLLSVHLKSGCANRPISSPEDACRQLARQIPELESWVDTQARAGRPFAILGDFNRDLLADERRGPVPGAPENPWAALDDGDPPDADLLNAAAGQPFRNCAPGQGFRAYIDHIVLSRTLAAALVPGSFSRVTYSAHDARRARLSDHCPVSVRLTWSSRSVRTSRLDAITPQSQDQSAPRVHH